MQDRWRDAGLTQFIKILRIFLNSTRLEEYPWLPPRKSRRVRVLELGKQTNIRIAKVLRTLLLSQDSQVMQSCFFKMCIKISRVFPLGLVLVYTMALRVSPSPLFQRERKKEKQEKRHTARRRTNPPGWGKKNENLAYWLSRRGTHRNHRRAWGSQKARPQPQHWICIWTVSPQVTLMLQKHTLRTIHTATQSITRLYFLI